MDDLDEFIADWLAPKPNVRMRKMEILTKDKLSVLKREIALRRQNYPRWVAQGKMKQRDAEYQLRAMEAILADYEEAERVAENLGVTSLI